MYKQDNIINRNSRKISCVKFDGVVTVTPIIERLSNIFENGDAPKAIKFILNAPNEFLYDIKIELEKPFGVILNLEELSAKAGNTVTVMLPDLRELFGVFTLNVTVLKDNDIVCVQPIPFSHIKTCNSYFKKSGFCTHLLKHDIEDTYNCLELMRKIGVRKIRDDFLWRFCETEKGNPVVLSEYHNTATAFLDAGFEINANFLEGNTYYVPTFRDGPNTEESLAAYIKYCETVARHFKGKITTYGVWNEYNLGWDETCDMPERYAWQLKATYKAVKAIDPNIKITAGVTCGTHPDWIRRILKAGAYDYFDMISIHPYCSIPDWAYPDEKMGQAEANVQCYKDIIKEFGPEKPVWISEMGWTSSAADGAVDRNEQAAAHTRIFTIVETGKTIEKITVYDFRDDGLDEFEMEHHWGVVEGQHSVVPNASKESYAALSFLNCMISDGELIDTNVTEKIKVTRLVKDGKPVNVIWSMDGYKKVTFALDSSAELYDMYGNRKEITVKDGEAELDINEYVTYITGSDIMVIGAQKPQLKYDFPYSVAAVPVLQDDGWYLKAVVKNHTFMLDGRIRVEIPELNISGNYEHFKIKNGENFETKPIKVENTDIKKLYRVVTDISLITGERRLVPELVSFLAVPFGKPDNILLNLNLDNDKYVKVLDTQPEYLNADIALSYDNENFYLKAVVKDKVHIQQGTTADNWIDIWDGDNIEIIIQPIYDGNSDKMRYNHIGLALSSNTGEPIIWRWRMVSNRSYGAFRNASLKTERKGDITSYFASIPWDELLPPNVELGDCDTFGFTLRVNNAESNPISVDGYLQLYSGIGSWRTPNSYISYEFGRITLK